MMLAGGVLLAGQEDRATGIAEAPAGALRVLCSTAFHFSPELLAAAEKAVGHPVVDGNPATLRKTQSESVALTVPELLVSPNAGFFGLLAVIWVALTTVTSVAGTPPIATVAPEKKFDPVIVTSVEPPGQPVVGAIDVMVGAALINSESGVV